MPFGAVRTVGRWLPGADGSATMRVGLTVATTGSEAAHAETGTAPATKIAIDTAAAKPRPVIHDKGRGGSPSAPSPLSVSAP